MRLLGLLMCAWVSVMNLAFAKAVILPVRFAQDVSVALVTLDINGTPTQFMLDSGSQIPLHLPMSTLQNLPQVAREADDYLSTDIAGNIIKTAKFEIKHLNINGMDFDHIQAVELQKWGFGFSSDPSEKLPPEPDENLPVIGLTLFANHVLTLDFAHQNIRVDDIDEDAQNDDKWVALPYLYDPQEGLIVELADQNKTYRLVIDTGATMSMVAGKSLPEHLKQGVDLSLDKQNEAAVRLNKNGKPETINIYLDNPAVKKLAIRAVIIDNMPKEFNADGLLGMDFLKKYMLRIDQKNQKLWIKAA